MDSPPKSLLWVGSCREDLKSFPEDVRLVVGYAPYLAQVGSKHPDAKPLRGFGGAGALEVVKLQGVVFALHAFQKKSRTRKKTPQQDRELVRRRLRRAKEIHAGMVKARGESNEEEG